jgi:hypothetical protein
MKRYFEAPAKHSWRRRFAPMLLALGLLGAMKLTYDVTPREQSVHLHVPDDLRATLQGVKLTYLEDGEAVTGSEQRFPEAAPTVVRSAPSLAPGRYQLDIELSQRTGAITRLRRDVTVPTEGALRIRLGESP